MTVNIKIWKFADNTKIYNKVDSVEGRPPIERMRADLRNLVVWSKERHITAELGNHDGALAA